jgi:hypothetical protein
VFTLELFDVAGIVNALVGAQIVFVGELSSICWTWVGALFDWEMYGEMDIEKGLADGDVGAEVACHRRVRCADSERLCASSRSTIE